MKSRALAILMTGDMMVTPEYERMYVCICYLEAMLNINFLNPLICDEEE